MRRFIAGAECPSCGEQDTLYVDVEVGHAESRRVRACTRCDFCEVLETPPEDGADPVRIILPKDRSGN